MVGSPFSHARAPSVSVTAGPSRPFPPDGADLLSSSSPLSFGLFPLSNACVHCMDVMPRRCRTLTSPTIAPLSAAASTSRPTAGRGRPHTSAAAGRATRTRKAER